ncbi:hypothetical protein O3P69_001240 [Scylla paramamosain]|uniref:Uncharacterized protein n=1 Tax=Scylla paramamosain TaxID=85552 RepID=A0AAW0UPQ8_SCYPA
MSHQLCSTRTKHFNIIFQSVANTHAGIMCVYKYIFWHDYYCKFGKKYTKLQQDSFQAQRPTANTSKK